MSASNKKIFSNMAVGVGSLVLLYLSITNNDNDFPKALAIIGIIGVAAGLLYAINLTEILTDTAERKNVDEKAYIEKMSDDMETIKIIVAVFATLSIATMLITIIAFITMFTKF